MGEIPPAEPGDIYSGDYFGFTCIPKGNRRSKYSVVIFGKNQVA